jgi:hypothetical protein
MSKNPPHRVLSASVISRSSQISIWPGTGLSARTARHLAIAIAIPMWLLALAFARTGIPTDFAVFYTMGALVVAHQPAALYDPEAFGDAQRRYVPDFGDSRLPFPPVYPPQAPVLFAPLGALPYQIARPLWTFLSAAAYCGVVWLAWRAVRADLPDGRLIAAAAVVFAPAWHVLVNQQVTTILLVACVAGWLALERGRPFLAGVALGVLALKPQFGLVLAPLVIARGEWRVMAGAMLSVVLQLVLAAVVLGSDAIRDYVSYLPWIAANADTLETLPFKSHSIRAITRFLPFGLSTPVWAISSIGLIAMAIRTWRPDVPLRLRLGLVILATLLVNPHLIVYDAVLLVLPLLWIGAAAARTSSPDRARWCCAVVVLFASFLAFFTGNVTICLVAMVVSVFTLLYVFAISARLAMAPA